MEDDIRGAVLRIDDVTDQVKLEEMMIQSEKMMSIGGLAAGMAHEINNPLSGMMQNTQVVTSRLTREIEANIRTAQELGIEFSKIKTYMEHRNIVNCLESIHAAGVRAGQVVQNMLSFARQSSMEKGLHDIIGIIEHTLELASTDYSANDGFDLKTIKIETNYEPNLPPVQCEESKIQQVVLNLLKNSFQAFGQLSDRNNFEPCIKINVHRQNDKVQIEISDNGPGMEKDVQNQIFDPFFTTKSSREGTGLGLFITHFIIVEDHKGQLELESAPGKGTTFKISLLTKIP
jgi:signal transduction histidine kinase